jgi:hypothetical protein
MNQSPGRSGFSRDARKGKSQPNAKTPCCGLHLAAKDRSFTDSSSSALPAFCTHWRMTAAAQPARPVRLNAEEIQALRTVTQWAAADAIYFGFTKP